MFSSSFSQSFCPQQETQVVRFGFLKKEVNWESIKKVSKETVEAIKQI